MTTNRLWRTTDDSVKIGKSQIVKQNLRIVINCYNMIT